MFVAVSIGTCTTTWRVTSLYVPVPVSVQVFVGVSYAPEYVQPSPESNGVAAPGSVLASVRPDTGAA